MQNTIDVFVSYVYRTSRKKEICGDASVALIVNEGVEVPEKPTRSMIEAVRGYLSDAHQVKPNMITIQFLTRLEPEVVYVPEDSDGGGDVQQGSVRQSVEGVLQEPREPAGGESPDPEDSTG